MKHFKHHSLAILPLLSLLATPPAMLEQKHNYRSIASQEQSSEEVNKGKIAIKPIDFKLEQGEHTEQEKLQVEIPEVASEDVNKGKIAIRPIDFKLEQTVHAEQEKLQVEIPEIASDDVNKGKIAIRPIDFKLEQGEHKKLQMDLPELKDVRFASSTQALEHPKFDSLVSKVNKENITKNLESDIKKFSNKKDELKKKIAKLKDEVKNESFDKKTATQKRDILESLVIDLLLVEGSLKDLNTKEAVSKVDEKATSEVISESKDLIEKLLTELEVSQEEEKTKLAAIETAKKENEKHICQAEEKNTVLNKQIEQLMADQNKIMQSMLGLSQIMMQNMIQQNQRQQLQPYQQMGQYPNQHAYQYHQPQTAGNWVYYPQGFRPNQDHIFDQPLNPYQPHAPMQPAGPYPDQSYQQSSWNVRPTLNFDQQFNTSAMVTPGTFGGSGFAYDMSNTVPTVSQR